MPAPKGSGELPIPFSSRELTDFVDCLLVLTWLTEVMIGVPHHPITVA